MVLKGAPLYEHAMNELTKYAKTLDNIHTLVVLTNDNPGAVSYMKALRRDCSQVGIHLIEYDIHQCDENPAILSEMPYGWALMVQTPIPDDVSKVFISMLYHRYGSKMIDYYRPDKAFDALQVWEQPVTPRAIMAMIRYFEFEIANRTPQLLRGLPITIVNRSNMIGKPLMHLALNENMLPKVMHSQISSINILNEMRTSKIIVSATGHPNYVKDDHIVSMITGPFLYIDLGTTADPVTGHIGDFSEEFYASFTDSRQFYMVPAVGGIGPITRAMLIATVFAFDHYNRVGEYHKKEYDKLCKFMRDIGTDTL